MPQEIADKVLKQDIKSIESSIRFVVKKLKELPSVMDSRWDPLVSRYNSLQLKYSRMTGGIIKANFDLF